MDKTILKITIVDFNTVEATQRFKNRTEIERERENAN